MITVFSKDRAFQLEACLRTLLARCEDVGDVPVQILWTASSPNHRKSYDILQAFYKSKATVRIEFIEESSFRRDLTMILGNLEKGSWRDRLVRLLSRTGSASWMQGFMQALISLLLRPKPTMLFVVDDTLFLRPFSFTRCSRDLLENDACLAFSLRLGQGLTRFYMGDCDQEVPEMILVDKDSQVYQFRWTEAKGDFEYPLEISSSILNLNLILPRLLRKKWNSPNTLEMAPTTWRGDIDKSIPCCSLFSSRARRFSSVEHGPERFCSTTATGGRSGIIRTRSVTCS